MVYVDVKALNRLEFEDDSLIKCNIITTGKSDNWGDNDCIKMVTEILECDVTIDKSIAEQFKNIDSLKFIRYNYYRPCYNIIGSLKEKIEDSDGNIIYKFRQ